MTNIRNLPEWAKSKKYLVIRPWGDEWEFFDAWDEGDEHYANAQSWEVNGKVIEQ